MVKNRCVRGPIKSKVFFSVKTSYYYFTYISGKKNVKKNWANEETVLHVKILIDADFNFADFVEWCAFKRSANKKV